MMLSDKEITLSCCTGSRDCWSCHKKNVDIERCVICNLHFVKFEDIFCSGEFHYCLGCGVDAIKLKTRQEERERIKRALRARYIQKKEERKQGKSRPLYEAGRLAGLMDCKFIIENWHEEHGILQHINPKKETE